MKILVGQSKGGVGKTTLALIIAIERALKGRDVLLVDADDQASATEITALRTQTLGSAGYTSVQLTDAAVLSEVRKLESKFDDVIIDAGGRDTVGLRAGLIVADVVLMPFRPRSIDLWTLDRMSGLITEARLVNPNLRALAVINCADPMGADNGDSSDYIRENDVVSLVEIPVRQRKAFPNALSMGLSVSEMKSPDPKACAEINALIETIFQNETAKAE